MNTRKPARLPLGDTENMLEQWGFYVLDRWLFDIELLWMI